MSAVRRLLKGGAGRSRKMVCVVVCMLVSGMLCECLQDVCRLGCKMVCNCWQAGVHDKTDVNEFLLQHRELRGQLGSA